jgi:two-component system response regulator FixJ
MQTSGRTETDPANGDEINKSEIVCLVDDDPSVRKSVGRLLESAGFGVRSFAEPKSFLDHLDKNPVPVAVLDIWMEKMTGMELLAHLCARSPQTRVIFITGHEDSAAQATVTQAGVFAFFLKPFDDDQFLTKVQEAFAPPKVENEKASKTSAGRD